MTKKTLILLFSLFFCSQVYAAGNPIQFASLNLKGDVYNSKRSNGKPLVISFFFTTCGPCKVEMPELYKIMKAKGKEKQLFFVDPYNKHLKFSGELDNKRAVKKFVKKLHIPMELVYFDAIGALTKSFIKEGIFKKAIAHKTPIVFPTIVILDKNHKPVKVLEGEGKAFVKELDKWF
ncbi:MAG: TlpA disulfide reductase family protein [SAR324 cluster bacterium]|nr:TlpA disulfide reductase family protein [SAR324 cluster bacterium]